VFETVDITTGATLLYATHDCHRCDEWQTATALPASRLNAEQVYTLDVLYLPPHSFRVNFMRLPGFISDPGRNSVYEGLFYGVVSIMVFVCFLVLSEAWRTRRLIQQHCLLHHRLEAAKSAEAAANKAYICRC
jgi:hypothetical protein